jgi:dihydrolipoamide dehydrogenase
MASTPTHAQIAIIGGGPGGYPAAFLASDMGFQVALIELEENPGGVCLYRGCIPSKALLHVARVIEESRDAEQWGLTYTEPKIDLDKMRSWKNSVISKLTGGLGSLSKARKISYVKGRAAFKNSSTLTITKSDGSHSEMTFDYAVVSTGSRPTIPPPLAIDSPRVMDSTGALNIEDIPGRLLVIGGGYIGCELGSVYAALGSKVTVVEMGPGLLMGADKDLADVVTRRLEERFHEIHLKTKVLKLEDTGSTVKATLEGLSITEPVQEFDRVLISVGRRPNSDGIGIENTRIQLDPRGCILVDKQRRTAEPNIFAIGDIAGDPMLAHKASHEGRIAIEVIAGQPSVFDPRAIPAVVFTDPEMAWCGLTETQAKTDGRSVKVATFPWKASGRATTLGRDDGLTKMILDPHTEQVLGVGIAGVGAGELIAEGVLAVEMAARAGDLKSTIHAHPTLSETMMEAAEIFFGHGTHSMAKK